LATTSTAYCLKVRAASIAFANNVSTNKTVGAPHAAEKKPEGPELAGDPDQGKEPDKLDTSV
jgi:hypothetical protein